MLNKTIRSTIIVTIQFIIPAVLLLIFAPAFLNHTHQLNQARAFFSTHQLHFLFAHCAFHIVLFWIWPILIKCLSTRFKHPIDNNQIEMAIHARWYLIAVMAFFELLTWWK